MTTVTESIARLELYLHDEGFFNPDNAGEYLRRKDQIHNLCMDIVKAAFQDAGDTAVKAINQKSKLTE